MTIIIVDYFEGGAGGGMLSFMTRIKFHGPYAIYCKLFSNYKIEIQIIAVSHEYFVDVYER